MGMPSSSRMRVLSLFGAMVVLAILLLAAHAPIFLNDGVVMDDWLVLQLRPDDPIDLSFLIKGAGHPVFFVYSWFANMTGTPVAVMVVMTVLAILAGAICLALAALRSGLLSRTEAIGVALLVWTYPGYQMWAGKANAVYVFSFGLFVVATWLLTLAFDAKGLRRVALRAATALAFFVSFALNSLMVLYVFAMFGLFVAVWQANGREQGSIRRLVLSAWRCAAGYPELVVLPLVYWGALNIWFKRSGDYAGYYGIRLPSFSDLLAGWRSFFQMGYVDVIARASRMAMDYRLLFVLAIVLLVIAAAMLALRSERPRLSVSRIAPPLCLGLLLFVALALPYLIAGIRPNQHFYETRHLLLFGLPAAFVVLSGKRLLESFIGERAAFVGTFGLALMVSVAALWSSYVFLQARVLKQEALSSHLAVMPMPAATVFNLDDGFYDHSPRHVPFGIAEVTGMLRLAWGDQPFFGFSLVSERPTVLQEMELSRTAKGSAYRRIDLSGPQATISLQPGPAAAPNAVLVRHYYACRLLARCDVAAFLKELAIVKIDIGPIAGVTPLEKSK
jgi:hypothetical protein